MTLPSPSPAPAPFLLPLALAGLTALMTACGGGGVSVPGGVNAPAPAPAPGPGAGPAPSPIPIERVSASCVDPAPAVTETAVFDTTETTGIAGDGTRVSANKSTVCFTTSATGAVRSNTAISQGANSFHYFEVTRSNSVSIGVGTASAPMAPVAPAAATDGIASTAQSLLITDGTVYTKGTNIPSFNVGAETKFGIAVDYRGPHPIVFVLGSTLVGQGVPSAAANCTPLPGVTADAVTPCVYGRHVLGNVTEPLYIYASGSNANQGNTATLSINTGSQVATKPFTYGALKVRQAVRGIAFKGEVGLNAQWPGTTGSPVTPLPTITAASRTRSVLVVGDTTPYAGSDSFSVTAPGSSVQWLDDTGDLLGATASLSLTDATVQGLIGTGTHRIQALATDSTTGKLNAVDFKVTYASSNADDTDGDGLDYAAEKVASTDPANPDTNGDGIADGVVQTVTAGSQVVLQREASTVSGLATSQGVILDDDQLTIVLNADVNPDCTDGTLPAAGDYGAQPLSEEQCKKRAIRANVGIQPGEFRYYETRRATASGINGYNLGQGFITRTGKIDPFCCAGATRDPRTPISFMVNSVDGAYDTLVSLGAPFSSANTDVVGFAVDYTDTSAPPVVYTITRDGSNAPTVFGPRSIAGFAGDAVPFVYGHPYSATLPAMEINFGLKTFAYDARTLLSGTPHIGSLVLGVGIHRRP